MTLLRSIAMATLAAASACALAQGGATPAATPAKKEMVQKVLQLQQTGADNIARGLAEQSIAPIAQQATSILQFRTPADQRDATARDIQAEFKKYGDDVVPLLRERAAKLMPTTVGTLMEEKFSEDELKQLLTMLESPSYKKYQQMMPEMQKALLEKLVAETRPTIEPKLRALQETIGKRLGLTNKATAASAPRNSASAARK